MCCLQCFLCLSVLLSCPIYYSLLLCVLSLAHSIVSLALLVVSLYFIFLTFSGVALLVFHLISTVCRVFHVLFLIPSPIVKLKVFYFEATLPHVCYVQFCRANFLTDIFRSNQQQLDSAQLTLQTLPLWSCVYKCPACCLFFFQCMILFFCLLSPLMGTKAIWR